MDQHYNYGYGYSYNYGQQQKQMSKVEQIQDQAYSYEVMGNFFSALEHYVYKCMNQSPIHMNFDYYNNFNCGNTKTKEQLRQQIITQMETFKYSYFLYIQKHGEYKFPNSLDKKQVIGLIKEWERHVPYQDKKYYSAVLDIINQKNVSYVNELIEGGSSATVDPRTIGDYNKVIAASQKFGEDVKYKYQNDSNYEPNIQIGQKNNGTYDNIYREKSKRKTFEDEIINKFHTIVEQLKKGNQQTLIYLLNEFVNQVKRYKTQYQSKPFDIDDTTYNYVYNLIKNCVYLSQLDIADFKLIIEELRFRDDYNK